MELNFTESNTEWVKFGRVKCLCFVGRDYLCFGGGCHMLFIHVNTRKETIYEAITEQNGEGVSCVAGLLPSPVFAFAENKPKARVFAMTCPEFKTISIMTEGTDDGYVDMVFTEAEFLITLSGLPTYSITIWNWRNGEKIATKETDVLMDDQLLQCSFGSSVFLAQLGVKTNQLNTWDILMCGKRCLLIQHRVTSPDYAGPFTSVQWTSDGCLFVLNTRGDIYMLNAGYNLDLVFTCNTLGNCFTYLVWYKAGLTVAGPDGVIKHYKKGETWKCDWNLKPQLPMVRLLTNGRDLLVGISETKDVMLYDLANNTFECIKSNESNYNGFCLIYPAGQYFITLAHNKELTAWRVSTGAMVDMLRVERKALQIKEHPEYPYFAVSFSNGFLELYSFYRDNKIKLLAAFHLTHNPLTDVKFFEAGKLMVVADMTCGQFFFIEGVPGTKMQILTSVTAGRQIADYILVASKTCLRLFAIPVTSTKFIAGNVILRFCIIKNRPCPDIREYELESSTLYSKLYPTTKLNRDRVFQAMPVESKSLHELEIKRGDLNARVIGIIPSGHLMRKVAFHFDNHHMLTFAYDGLVNVRSKGYHHLAVIRPHHRREGGVSAAYVDPLGKYVISLGRNNVLVCTNLNAEVKIEKELKLQDILESKIVTYMFTQPTIGFLLTGEHEGKTWLDMQKLLIIEHERQRCARERQSILTGIDDIKRQVRDLLTQNLEGQENELLDLQEFNLDTDLKEELIRACQVECNETKTYLEALIVARNKVSDWIRGYCWDTMQTPSKSLFGIFGIHEVENFCLLPDDVQLGESLKRIAEYRAAEQLLTHDKFEPWIQKTASQVKFQMSIVPTVEKTKQPMTPPGEDNDDDDIDVESATVKSSDDENITAFSGSIKHHFVPIEAGHYDQFELQTSVHLRYQTILSEVENVKMKQFFNKKFEFLKSLKIRELNNVVERNARLRNIISELNYFSVDKIDIIIEDPIWEQKENPELILKVVDKEVAAKIYVSPSQQAKLDAEAAEHERLRLLMLADDFKERALMAMMNGVLEISWKDELRKDVPVPKCMLEKKPEDYREDDLRTIREYENQVNFLQSERERYKGILEVEYVNVGESLREGVKKFNMRLQELLVLKIRVESAICQENLKINRLRLKSFKLMQSNKLEIEAQKAILLNETKMTKTQKLISSLHENLQECRSLSDAVQAKEKILEKAFRRDFLETSPVCQEVVQKFYRKRPKTNVRGITSLTVLLELSKCVVTRERTLILNHEALEFLKAMDHLDQYIGVPNAVDESAYTLLCKHRRLKIECEIKGKAAGIQIAECEQNISTLHRTLVQKKDLNQDLMNNLAQVRTIKLMDSHDIQLQLVMKQALVEVPTSGEFKDFDDVILISRRDVEEINKIILKAGEKKLNAMRDTMNFRRGILEMEWKHRKMRMIIADRLDHIGDIHSAKVTKETQTYLKMKARADSTLKQLTFEQEVEIVKQSYTRVIEERKTAVAELEARISTVFKDNNVLDKKIEDINVDVHAQSLDVDQSVGEKEKRIMKLRTATFLKRTALVNEIQKNHNMILMLQTELEILRLKTFPTLKYKLIG